MKPKKTLPKIKAQISAELYRALSKEIRETGVKRPDVIAEIVLHARAFDMLFVAENSVFRRHLKSARTSSPCAVHFYATAKHIYIIEHCMRTFAFGSVSECVRAIIMAWNDANKDANTYLPHTSH